MVQFQLLELDLQPLQSVACLLETMAEIFEFAPQYPAQNLDAAIDVLSSLRIPEDEMTLNHLAHDEAILLSVTHVSDAPLEVKDSLMTLVAATNSRLHEMGDLPAIYLLLIE